MTRALFAAWLVLAAVPPAMAQDDGPAFRPHHVTISAGTTLLGGYDIGSVNATLRRNETGTSTPGPLTLFVADGALNRAAAVEARIGYPLTRVLALEFGGSYSRPTVAVDVSGDTEAGSSEPLTDQRLSQYLIDVSVLWQISQLKLGGRARPYVTAGAGYLRQLDIDRVRAETGKTFQFGAGVHYWLRGGDAARRALGVRAQVNAMLRSGGLDFDGATRLAPAVKLFAFVSL
jgi:opacity protein-like surface antigen